MAAATDANIVRTLARRSAGIARARLRRDGRRPSPIPPRPRTRRRSDFPGELVENWHDKAIARLGELVDGSRALARLSRLLRQMRRLHRQVPLFPRHRRSRRTCRSRARICCARSIGAISPGPANTCPGWSAPRISPRRCSTTGTAISTSARSAGAARSSAPTASTPPKSPWPRATSWTRSAWGRNTRNEIIGKVFKIGNNLGLPPKALKATLAGTGGGDRGGDRRRASSCRSTRRAPTSCWSRRAPISSPRRTWKA